MTVDEARSRLKQCDKEYNKQMEDLKSAAYEVGAAAESAAQDRLRSARSSARGHKLRMIFIPLGVTFGLTILLWSQRHEVWGTLLLIAGVLLTIKLGSLAGNSGSRNVGAAKSELDTVVSRRSTFKNALGSNRTNN